MKDDYLHVYTYVYTHMYTHKHTYMHTYIYTHIYAHKHTHVKHTCKTHTNPPLSGQYTNEWQQHVLTHIALYGVLLPLLIDRCTDRIASARDETALRDLHRVCVLYIDIGYVYYILT